MRLVHYSAKPIVSVHSVSHRKGAGRRGDGDVSDKPAGFWVSDDDAEMNWREWCLGENFHLEALRYKQEVILSPHAKMLYLNSAADLDSFTREYGASPYSGWERRYINWRPIVRDYQGIVITPYIWERRLSNDVPWYYGWDCASGVIWDARAVESLLIDQPGAELAA